MKKTATLLATAALLLATGSPANAAKPGNLDKSFSGDGKTQQAFGGGYQRVTSRDVLVTSTGKVVVVSELRKPGATYWGIARMRKDGKPDPVFRGNGRRTTAFEHDDVPHRVVSQGQGRILVGGSGGGAFALASYDSDGSPNHPFGGAGKVTTDITPGDDVVLDLQVLPGGKVLAAGLAGDQFAVVRYLPTGVPDDTFGGGDGIVLTTDGFDGTAYDVALQPDGRLLATGSTPPDGGLVGVAVSRFDTDGSLDETFGGDGRVETFPSSREVSRGYDVKVQPDGKVVVGGYAFGEGAYSYFLLARYRANGTPDGTFGADGVVATLFQPYYAEVHAIALQPDGKIVAAGWSEGETPGRVLAVARYGRGGKLDKNFSGNGKNYVSYGSNKRGQAFGLAVRDGRIVAVGEVTNINATRSEGVAVAFVQ